MAIQLNDGRQEPLVAEAAFGFADLVSGVASTICEIPAGAIVQSILLVVDTAWNSGTSDSLVVGDAGSANRYMGATSIAATGVKACTPTGYQHTNATNAIKATWTGVGAAPTTGAARAFIQYIVPGKAEEVYRGSW